jgi:hypothetical protein
MHVHRPQNFHAGSQAVKVKVCAATRQGLTLTEPVAHGMVGV